MANTENAGTPDKKIQTPAENHKTAADHHTEASKHHIEAAKHHESGNPEKANESTVKAAGHASMAAEAQNETLKMHATKK